MSPDVIHQGKSFLVIDKPSGWVTNDAVSVKVPTIQKWVRDNVQGSSINNLKFRNGIVHRLDKETSGVLLVAKTAKSFSNLQKQFKKRVVNKSYMALVHGEVGEKKGVVSQPVGRLPWNRERFGVLPGGREASTQYSVSRILYRLYDGKKEFYSLVELKPKTGRTHQIRIHMKHIGHPLVSDEFYAGRKTARADRKWCPRLFLHAGGISFNHPDSGKKVSFESELPKDLKGALEELRMIY